ncbi:MAG: sigma 54-interacting transcriptional regulator [Myxococcota bacterium]
MELEGLLRRNGVGESFRALAELLPGAAVVVTDAERRVLYWSPEAARIVGHAAERMEGRVCPDGVICDRDEARPFGASVQLTRADGTSVWVRHYARVLPDGGAIHLLALDTEGHGTSGRSASGPGVTDFHGLITRDRSMLRVIQVVRNVAETETSVLVRGESGTGKELVAHAIHLEGRRRNGPFVAVNCAAFTPTLLESELFGHTKGAFTGAVASRKGIFAQADGGTLFLDEVAELPLDLQAKLLRVLQERTFVPVGGTEPVHTNVRVVAATHRALREEVRAGRFRDDLMFRLRVVPIFLPPLRQRPSDIELLVRHFIEQAQRGSPRVVTSIAPEAMRALLSYPWPGNVRELSNVVEYAFAVGRGPVLTLEDLPPELREAGEVRPRTSGASGSPGRARSTPRVPVASIGEAERVREALEVCQGDIHAAAERLGVSRTTFWRMRKRAGLD